jgi:hypothetical protein
MAITNRPQHITLGRIVMAKAFRSLLQAFRPAFIADTVFASMKKNSIGARADACQFPALLPKPALRDGFGTKTGLPQNDRELERA